MAEPSIIIKPEKSFHFQLIPEKSFHFQLNPEKSFNFQRNPETNRKKTVQSLYNSKFNLQDFEIAEFTENSFNFTDNLFFNCLGFIDFHGGKPTFNGSNNLPFIFGGTGGSDSSFISSILNSTKASPVRKLADAEPGGVLRQMEMMAIHGDSADYEGGGVHGGNGRGSGGNNEGGSGDGNGGRDEGDGNRNAGNDDGDGIGDGDKRWWKLWIEPIRVRGISVCLNDGSTYSSPTIVTGTYGYQYDSWKDISGALLDLWMEINEEFMYIDRNKYPDPEKEDVNPYCCVPGCVTLFGRYEGDCFYNFEWYNYEWEDVQQLIKDVVVLRPAKQPQDDY